MRRATALGTVLGALVLAAPAQGAVHCGDHLSADTTLKKDLDCPEMSAGLTIDADNVTLDLGGNTISGADPDTSGVLVDGALRAKVTNGRIDGFRRGVEALSARKLTLTKLTITHPGDETVRLNNVFGATVSRSKLKDPGAETAVFAFGLSEDVEVTDSKLTGGGISFESGEDFTATGNEIVDSGQEGVELNDISGATVTDNVIDNTEKVGVDVSDEAAGEISIARNTIISADLGGISIAGGEHSTKAKDNTVLDTSSDGIFVAAGAGAVLSGNVVKRSSADGILVDDDDATKIVGNTANANGDHGIDSASANGSGNVAKHNGADPQCNPGSLCA